MRFLIVLVLLIARVGKAEFEKTIDQLKSDHVNFYSSFAETAGFYVFGTRVSGDRYKIKAIESETGNTLMNFESPSALGFLQSASIEMVSGYKQPLLITMWTTGASGVAFRIFNPRLPKPLLLEYISGGNISYKNNLTHLRILIPEDTSSGGKSVLPGIVEWKPSRVK